jgi:cytochrome c-type biogenesis protein CcmH
MSRICHLLIASAILASPIAAQPTGSPRVKAISGKVLCDCGCREVLGDCEHKACKRKPAMEKEILLAAARGESDDQILQRLAAAHGADILLTPRFDGFNSLLWIVPVTMGLAATVATVLIHKRRQASR